MKKTLVAALALACAGIAPLATAGGQQVRAEVSPDGQALVVRTYRCGTPASLSLRGSAEGIVSGERGVSALVTLEPGAPLRIADQRQSLDKPSADRIAAALVGETPAAR